MDQDPNPHSPSACSSKQLDIPAKARQYRGPLLYFASAAIVAIVLAIPLIVPRSFAVKDDPNPIGYLLILTSLPVGGLIYRFRSRKWPIDNAVRKRQCAACWATLLLPIAIALLTGMRAQGLAMTILSGIVSLVLMAGILISGQRRGRYIE